MIVILFTGGTIAMRNDPDGSGAQPALTPEEILHATSGHCVSHLGGTHGRSRRNCPFAENLCCLHAIAKN